MSASLLINAMSHSEKFKMNEDVDSFLSEKVSNETPPLIVSQDGRLSAATLKYKLLPQQEYQF